jgi:DNA-binding transcriptional LysR family regulator
MVITAAGRDVLEHAARVMEELDVICSSASGGNSSFRGVVTVGTTPTVASIATVPLMRKIRQQYPQLVVRLASAFSGHLLDWVQRGELDVAASYNPQPLKSLRIIPVMVEDLLLVSTGDRLSMDKPVPFARLGPVDGLGDDPEGGVFRSERR